MQTSPSKSISHHHELQTITNPKPKHTRATVNINRIQRHLTADIGVPLLVSYGPSYSPKPIVPKKEPMFMVGLHLPVQAAAQGENAGMKARSRAFAAEV